MTTIELDRTVSIKVDNSAPIVRVSLVQHPGGAPSLSIFKALPVLRGGKRSLALGAEPRLESARFGVASPPSFSCIARARGGVRCRSREEVCTPQTRETREIKQTKLGNL